MFLRQKNRSQMPFEVLILYTPWVLTKPINLPGIFGKAVSSLAQWMMDIFGMRCDMLREIPFAREWSRVQSYLHGQARRHIAV